MNRTLVVYSSSGILIIDGDGNIIERRPYPNVDSFYPEIVRFDMPDFNAWRAKHNLPEEISCDIDILNLAYWYIDEDGQTKYEPHCRERFKDVEGAEYLAN